MTIQTIISNWTEELLSQRMSERTRGPEGPDALP